MRRLATLVFVGTLFCPLLALAQAGPILQSLQGQQAPQQQTPQGGLGNQGGQQQQVLAQGAGGLLTVDGANAYIEALEFSLGQVGHPTRFDQGTRAQIVRQLALNFASLPAENQQGLSQARLIWTQYYQAWAGLAMAQKQEFAFSVLSLMYGEQAAAQAVGYNQGGGSGAGGDNNSYGGVNIDQPYAGSDCWASAGCGGYDGATDSYSYETYE